MQLNVNWEQKFSSFMGLKGHICGLWLVDFDPLCSFVMTAKTAIICKVLKFRELVWYCKPQ